MPSKPEHPAIILGMTETCLGPARSLGRAGVRVIGLDSVPGIGFRSRYVEARLCPDPLADQEQFAGFMVELAQELGTPPVVLFTADVFALAAARMQERLGPHVLMNTPDRVLMERIIDKKRQMEVAESVGIQIPATWLLDSRNALESADLPYPVFVKGCSSFRWCEITCDVKGFVANTKADLLSEAGPIIDKGVSLVAQQIITGPDTNHFKVCIFVNREGDPSLVFTLRKLRQFPPRFGVGSCVESIDMPELAEFGVKLFKGLGYRGIGSAEFKLDERDGVFKLIELNPRLWQQNSLAARCGADFAWAYYADLAGLQYEAPSEFELGVKWVNLELDLRSFQEYSRAGELTYRAWRESLRGPKVISDYDRDDMRPFIHNAREKRWLSRYAREWARGRLRA